MTETLRQYTKKVGLPRIIIAGFFVVLFFVSIILNLPFLTLISDTLRRFGMYGVLVLAMVPAIKSGIGPNFALPIGIICGLLGSLISIEIGLIGLKCFLAAIVISIPFAVLTGLVYGLFLNKIKGSEMLVATYTGFSIVSLMSIMWILLPFKHDEMVWPIGNGLRVTISLDSTFGQILNDFLAFNIGSVKIPTGLLLFFFALCYLVWLFFRSKQGVAIKTAGENPKFAVASGIDVDRCRLIGTVLSTVLGAIGIIVYEQSYGFMQLYQAPLMMAFPAVAAILIGGASARKAKISHAILGVFLFQGILTIALPVANQVVKEGNLAECLRMIIQNGIILYALTKVEGEE